MDSKKITATELARSLSDVLSRVYFRGEIFTIERNGRPVARLGPADRKPHGTWKDVAEALKDVPWPLEGFADDLEAVRSSQQKIGAPRWDN